MARDRCINPKNPKYKIYGGRGIKLCDRWKDFEKFYEDMGDRPSTEYSIDRKDVNGNYEKKNCRWAKRREQQRNQTVTRYLEMDGEKLDIHTFAEKHKIKVTTLRGRLAKGLKPKEAVEYVNLRRVNKR
jgi:hypothetical protein